LLTSNQGILDQAWHSMSEPAIERATDTQGLEQAFGLFNELSSQLTDAYGQLEDRVASLTAELAQARQQRLAERVQKEHLADQLEVLLEALPAGVILIDVRDRVDRFNPAAEQLFPSLAWGRRWPEICQEAVENMPMPGDWQLLDGRRVSVSQRPLIDRGRILVIVDITEQRQLQERAERQDRLGAMGEMAAQLAHQVRTPLSTAVLYAGHLANSRLDETRRQAFAAKLLDGLRHTETLVREMLAFSRGGNFSRRPVALVDVVETALSGVAPRLRQLDAIVDCDVEHLDGRRVMGNLDALAGALRNVIDNALDHCGTDPRLRIEGRIDSRGLAELAVHDNGSGIDPGLLARIFDPFFTTRERGTGLGLAVVQSVLLEHDGSVSAARSPDGGACFTLQFPPLAGVAELPDTERTLVI
jgi:two-component system sensor histidine kinase FlrB